MDPYLISTSAHLTALAANSPYWACAFQQTSNITLSSEWTNRIGNNLTSFFSGSYEGSNFTIDGLSITTSTVSTTSHTLYVGLFGVLSDGATVANLRLSGNINTPKIDAFMRQLCGLLAGTLREYSAVYNIHTSGLVLGQVAVGGLIGYVVQSIVHTCSSTATIVNDNNWWTGGLIGYMSTGATTIRSFATGNVRGTNFVGGLVGSLWPQTVAQAGPVGVIIVKLSYATGNVNATSAWSGGLVGLMNEQPNAASASRLVVDNSWASGDVRAAAASGNVGGLVGMKHRSPNSTYFATISYSYALGAVTGNVLTTGGLLGVLGSNNITANPYGSIISSFWNPTNAGPGANSTNDFGTQTTQAAMRDISIYSSSGWQISDTSSANCWGICSGGVGFPFLSWTQPSWPC